MIVPLYWGSVALLALATALPLLRWESWWVRGLDFPRLQLSFVAILLCLVSLIGIYRGWPLAVPGLLLCLACLAYQLKWILPYLPLWPKEVAAARVVEPGRHIAILTSNVLTPNRNGAGLLALVREHQPDLLVTLESDGWWEEQLDQLLDDYPHTIKCPLDNLYGMHVYSRLPLAESTIEFLVEDDVPSMHTLVHLPAGDSVRMHFLHPAPPSPTENAASSERDAELVMVARSVANNPGPVIVTGDLNDVAWSETTRLFQRISGLLDPRIGRGMFNTFHAKYPWLRWPLDHVFHSTHFKLVKLQRLRGYGSDHFPLLATLALQPVRAPREQEAPDPDSDDRALARDKLAQMGVSAGEVPVPGRH